MFHKVSGPIACVSNLAHVTAHLNLSNLRVGPSRPSLIANNLVVTIGRTFPNHCQNWEHFVTSKSSGCYLQVEETFYEVITY